MDERIDLLSLTPAALETFVVGLGQPRFRAGQLFAWLHGRGATDFDGMTDQPATLRERLAQTARIDRARIESVAASADGTKKYLVAFADGQTVEAVGLPAGDRLTVCFSTQAGCAMGCTFCATGIDGLARSLTAGEMVEQIRLVGADFGRRVSNAVAMGQGEPFANYDATLDALRILNAPKGYEIGARHLTVSTCGVVYGIDRFATEPEQFTLAISLHSAIQSVRDRLMPGVAGTPLPRLRTAIDAYEKATGRRPTLEYALIDGVNDDAGALHALEEFCTGLHVHVNLIPMNPVAGTGIRRADASRVAAFEEGLRGIGVETSTRVERGVDIDAACGQLRRRVEGR
jgi:23S rRNA (adenine2503-C2)-methyltransferase